MNFPSYKRCGRCGGTFLGGPSQWKCGACLERARRGRRGGPRRAAAPTPYREALALGDAGLAQQASRGELD